MAKASTKDSVDVIGIDLGDRWSEVCIFRSDGPDRAERQRVPTTPKGVKDLLEGRAPSRVVIEAGMHSPWADQVIRETGHESVVANPRQVALISKANRKTDRNDAETLARLARVDVKLLRPIRHRGEEARCGLEKLRARDALVRARTQLVNHVRGAVKPRGLRLNSSSSEAFARAAWEALPTELCELFEPLLEAIQAITDRIEIYDKRIAQLCKRHSATQALRQVTGVGALTSLAFVLTIDDPSRFSRSRQVGAYLGLCPRSDQSGDSNRQLGITKAGSSMMRRLLVQSAHYIMGRFGPDTALRRYGLALAARGGGNSKKRAVVAVARRLAVLLIHLWRTGEVYEPLRGVKVSQDATAPTP